MEVYGTPIASTAGFYRIASQNIAAETVQNTAKHFSNMTGTDDTYCFLIEIKTKQAIQEKFCSRMRL